MSKSRATSRDLASLVLDEVRDDHEEPAESVGGLGRLLWTGALSRHALPPGEPLPGPEAVGLHRFGVRAERQYPRSKVIPRPGRNHGFHPAVVAGSEHVGAGHSRSRPPRDFRRERHAGSFFGLSRSPRSCLHMIARTESVRRCAPLAGHFRAVRHSRQAEGADLVPLAVQPDQIPMARAVHEAVSVDVGVRRGPRATSCIPNRTLRLKGARPRPSRGRPGRPPRREGPPDETGQ